MQTSYGSNAEQAVAGMLADSGNTDIVTAHNLGAKAYSVSVDTVTNSLLYRATVTFLSRASATIGVSTSVNCDYTADGSATKAEIIAGLIAAINAAAVPVTASAVDSDNGPILVKADSADQLFTMTVSSAMTATVASGEIPFGVIVVMDGAADKCRLPELASDIGAKTLGLALRTLALENNLDGTNVYPAKSAINVLKKGRAWVEVEDTVVAGDSVYVRHEANGSDSQLGAVRPNMDGVAQVTTITPTAVNSTVYNMSINGRAYSYTSDGSATAAEIVAGFTALIDADSDNGVVCSGTNTLILTADVEGVPFVVSLGANLSAAATTANAAYTTLLSGAKFLTAASAGGLAKIELNLA